MFLLAALSACVQLIIENPVLSEMPQARNDAALVYFFQPDSRHSHYRFSKNQFRYSYVYVYDDDSDEFLGGLKPGSFFSVNFVPGAHNISCLAINLEAGQTYYLERGLELGAINYVRFSTSVTKDPDTIDPRVHSDGKRLFTVRMDLCHPKFVAVTPEYAKLIIASLTYTIVKIDGKTESKRD